MKYYLYEYNKDRGIFRVSSEMDKPEFIYIKCETLHNVLMEWCQSSWDIRQVEKSSLVKEITEAQAFAELL